MKCTDRRKEKLQLVQNGLLVSNTNPQTGLVLGSYTVFGELI